MNVPFVVYEAERVRSERRISALIAALIAAVSLLLASNIGWAVYYKSQKSTAQKTPEITNSVSVHKVPMCLPPAQRKEVKRKK
nr:MAG TPA: hypothetical protein [Caudoviricetes sp.]